MCHEWSRGTDDNRKKNYVHMVLIDFSKAFDHINPNILLHKLRQMDDPNFLLHCVMDFLSNCVQTVRVSESMSAPHDIWRTIPQGIKLGVFPF